MATQQQVRNELLNTSSEFHLATPNNNNNNHNHNNIALTPSIPNSQLRNLTISTPIENNENKEKKEMECDDDSIINDENVYISIIDNKRLTKICQNNPNKTYNRIQAKNIKKYENEIKSMMKIMIDKKSKKFEKTQEKQEKQEKDDENKLETMISNENKLEIIEKSLNACCAQLIHFNKLFLTPIQKMESNITKKQICKNKKEMKLKINEIKLQIENKRKKLIENIQILNKLRNRIKTINIDIPQNIKQKIIKNMDYNDNDNDYHNHNDNDQTMINMINLINNNKKKEMMEKKKKFDELKENEIRLKQKADKIKNDESKLMKFIELKKNVNNRDNTDNTDNNDNNINNKKRAMSMASTVSSIESTIHGSISPLIFDFKHKELKNKINFKTIKLNDKDPTDIPL